MKFLVWLISNSVDCVVVLEMGYHYSRKKAL